MFFWALRNKTDGRQVCSLWLCKCSTEKKGINCSHCPLGQEIWDEAVLRESWGWRVKTQCLQEPVIYSAWGGHERCVGHICFRQCWLSFDNGVDLVTFLSSYLLPFYIAISMLLLPAVWSHIRPQSREGLTIRSHTSEDQWSSCRESLAQWGFPGAAQLPRAVHMAAFWSLRYG